MSHRHHNWRSNEDDYIEDVFEERDYMVSQGFGFERCWFPTDFEVSPEAALGVGERAKAPGSQNGAAPFSRRTLREEEA